MSGWQAPTPPPEPPPRSYWAQPAEGDPLSAGQLIRRAWRLYRATPGRFVLVAAIPNLIQGILALPAVAIAVGVAQSMFEVVADYVARIAANPEAYRYVDQRVLQAELEAQLRGALLPQADLAALSAIGGGAGVAVGLIGSAALTATALATATGRPISVAFAFRLVTARAGLIKPIVAIGIGWIAVSWFSLALQTSTDVQVWAGAAGSPRSVLLAGLLSVLAVIVLVGVIVAAVRWALFIPAVLVEALGVGAGLARAAALTRGIRFRLGLATAAFVLLETVLVAIAAAAIGVTIGLATQSVTVGFIAYLVVGLIGSVLWAPLVPAMLALAYRDRTYGAVAPTAPAAAAS